MKTPRLFNPNRMFGFVRLAVAGTCVLTAVALALVATATNYNSSGPVSKTPVLKPSAQDSRVGYEISEKDGSSNPTAAAEEDVANRAFPAAELDLSTLINAQAGLVDFLAHATPTPAPTPEPTVTPAPTATPSPTATPKRKRRSGRRTAAAPTPTPATIIDDRPSPPEPPQIPIWQEVTGNTAIDPNVLTFTGSAQNISGRITALALDTFNGCTAGFCRVWVGAAGGGIWRTTNALAVTPTWTYISGPTMGSQAIGTMTYFNNGTANGILYVGTGEPNASADSEAGLGIYRSTDGGNTWTLLNSQIGPITTVSPGTGPNGTYTGSAFLGRAISGIAVDPTNANILYVSSARGVRGVTSTFNGATSNPPTPRPPFGLFKSIDGGNTFSYIWDGSATCPLSCLGGDASASVRGVNEVKLDPSNHLIVYASAFPGANGTGGGVWRSNDGGTNWVQIKTALNSTDNVDRCTFALNPFAGDTRMYVGCGNDGTNTAHVYRNDAVQTGAPVFTDLSAGEPPANPYTLGYCTGQCWYDNVVYSPPGFPNIVYVGGSFDYGEFGRGSDGRGVVLSQDAGATWTDQTWDAQNNGTPAGSCCQPNPIAPNGIHPDQHALFTHPGNPFLFFEGSDGGLVRTDGNLVNINGQCINPRVIDGAITTVGELTQCTQLLSAVPNQIFGLNSGLRTLQFQTVSVASDNVNHFQGGTQDNGTWDSFGTSTFFQEIYGDGGFSGFNVANSAIRFNSFFGQQQDGNFRNGNPLFWVEITGPILFSPEGSAFYPPTVADPVLAGTIFEGSYHVWRTPDNGGSQVFLETNCNEFGPYSPTCGDFVTLGGVAGANDAGNLRGTFYAGRAGGTVNVIARTPSNANTAWAATSGGRIFISDNINAAAASVVWNRIDNNGANGDPGRVPTGIFVDPFNSHHAWITYSGYNFNTPAQPGHIFSVFWPGAGTASFTKIDGNVWDVPILSIVFDSVTGDLYASSDFVVFHLPNNNFNGGQWFIAGLNMPIVEIPSLTIIPGQRVLYAATHGRGIWKLNLP
jgi:hypothetical protein